MGCRADRRILRLLRPTWDEDDLKGTRAVQPPGDVSASLLSLSQQDQWATTIAHRGGGWEAGENTLLGIRRAKALGHVPVVEIDVRLSVDGVPVLMHDALLERTTTGTGPLADHTAAQLRQLHIPTLHEALDLCHELDLGVLLDIKVYTAGMADAVVAALQVRPWTREMVVVCCFHPGFLARVYRRDPDVLRAFLWRPHMATMVAHLRAQQSFGWVTLASAIDTLIDTGTRAWLWWYAGGVDLVMAFKGALSEDELRLWRNRGLLVIAWTVNDELEKIHFRARLRCAIITDFPRHRQFDLPPPDE